MKFFLRFVVSVIFLSLSGCGYTTQVLLPNGIQSLAVPTFQNKLPQATTLSYEPGIESAVTNAILSRLNYDGNLKVVAGDEADAILRGSVTGYEQEAIRFQDRSDVQEYSLFLSVDLELFDTHTQEVIWSEKGFTGRTEFFRTGGRAITERAALLIAAEDLARKVVDRIVEDW